MTESWWHDHLRRLESNSKRLKICKWLIRSTLNLLCRGRLTSFLSCIRQTHIHSHNSMLLHQHDPVQLCPPLPRPGPPLTQSFGDMRWGIQRTCSSVHLILLTPPPFPTPSAGTDGLTLQTSNTSARQAQQAGCNELGLTRVRMIHTFT